MITNLEYEEALEDPNNIRIMQSACDGFRNVLDPSALEGCRLHGLYKCMQVHDSELGNKFTSSLYWHVIWQCQRALHEQRRLTSECELTIDPEFYDRSDLAVMVEDCLELLDTREANMVRDRYLFNMTFEELSRKYNCTPRGAKFIIERAIELLRVELCGV